MTHVTRRLTAKNRDQLQNPRSIIEYGLPLPLHDVIMWQCGDWSCGCVGFGGARTWDIAVVQLQSDGSDADQVPRLHEPHGSVVHATTFVCLSSCSCVLGSYSFVKLKFSDYDFAVALPDLSTSVVPWRCLTPGTRFTKYLTTISRFSYDNAKVTIDLRQASNLLNIL